MISYGMIPSWQSATNFSKDMSKYRWENNIAMGLGEIGWGDMDWIDLAQDRDQWQALVNTVMNSWFP
jgi:hypothetical protein